MFLFFVVVAFFKEQGRIEKKQGFYNYLFEKEQRVSEKEQVFEKEHAGFEKEYDVCFARNGISPREI